MKLTRDAGIDQHIVRLLRQRDTCTLVLAVEVREGPDTSRQSRASHDDDWPTLRGDDGTYHSLGIAGKVTGKSSNKQWALRQLW